MSQRQHIAEAFQSLQDDVAPLFLEDTLDALIGISSSDPRMGELCSKLRALVDTDEDNEERVRAIRTLRAHISEMYRLDRRLVRTSREATDVANDLPRRSGPSLLEHECVARAAVGDLVEAWRRSASLEVSTRNDAPAAMRAHTLFFELLESALSHPAKFHAWMAQRAASLDDGDQAVFEGERAWLADNEDSVALTPEDDPRMSVLARAVEAQRKSGLRCVIFVDAPTVADAVFASLLKQYPGKILRAPFPAGAEPGAVAIVCDRTSEEGLNLQGERSVIIHFDLPLSPNRIEQRTGRVDRIGAKSRQVRSIIFVTRSPWELGWTACLEHGVKVFSRSVAVLQYALDESMRAIRARLLHDGPLTLEDATKAMADETTGLGRELARIRAQTMLDAIERDEAESATFFERLEASDDEEDEILAAVDGWAVDCLRFDRRREDGKATASCYAYVAGRDQERRQSTLLPATALAGPLRRAIDPAYSRLRGERRTHRMTASRRLAAREEARLLRIGNPFVDGLITLAEADDRGIAWALWRHVPRYPAKDRVDVFFRFDFVVMADAREAVDLVRASNGSVHAVRRRADAAFLPQFLAVWVRRDGMPVREPRLVELLDGEYQKKMDGWADVSLNAQRWPVIASRGLLQGWESDVRLARRSAEEELRAEIALERRCAEAARQLEQVSNEQIARLMSRLDRLGPGPARDREAREIDFERRFREVLVAGIIRPVLRLDAVGAIFMSSENPFDGQLA